MNKYFLIVILLFLSQIFGQNFTEYRLSSPTLILITPDSLEIKKMKQEMGDDFYTVADDMTFYSSQLYDTVKKFKLTLYNTTERLIRVITATDTLELDMNSKNSKWWSIFCNGRKILESEIYEIDDLDDFFKEN